jgi:hypothetical protein
LFVNFVLALFWYFSKQALCTVGAIADVFAFACVASCLYGRSFNYYLSTQVLSSVDAVPVLLVLVWALFVIFQRTIFVQLALLLMYIFAFACVAGSLLLRALFYLQHSLCNFSALAPCVRSCINC